MGKAEHRTGQFSFNNNPHPASKLDVSYQVGGLASRLRSRLVSGLRSGLASRLRIRLRSGLVSSLASGLRSRHSEIRIYSPIVFNYMMNWN